MASAPCGDISLTIPPAHRQTGRGLIVHRLSLKKGDLDIPTRRHQPRVQPAGGDWPPLAKIRAVMSNSWRPTARDDLPEMGLQAARARSKAFALKLGGDIAESVGEAGANGCHSENGGNGDQRGD